MSELEWITLVNEHDTILGKEDRVIARKKALLHRGVGVLVFNSNQELLVHKRSSEKTVYPNLFDVIVGGSVLWNESYSQAAIRELQEEIGLNCLDLKFLFPFKYRSIERNLNFEIFTCIMNQKAVLQKEEIKYSLFLNLDQVIELMKSEGFCPYAHGIMNEYFKLIHKPLVIE
ncbi:MAG: NUDIX domain-containing protein [Candidatus Diapherotrites archaeon]|nr:NUDIX domain-containing protein [Candidatus Diapherotrites archaeon]